MRSDNPIKGNYQIVKKTGQDYIGVYNAIRESASGLDRISSTDRFRSEAISAIRERVSNLRKSLNVIKERYRETGEALVTYAARQHEAQIEADEALRKKEQSENEKRRINDRLAGARNEINAASNEISQINRSLFLLAKPVLSDAEKSEKLRLDRRKNTLESAIRTLRSRINGYESEIRSKDWAIANADSIVRGAVQKRDRAADRAADTIQATNSKNDGLNDGVFDKARDALNAAVEWTSEVFEAIKNGDWDTVLDKLADVVKTIADVLGIISIVLIVAGLILTPLGIGAGLLAIGLLISKIGVILDVVVLSLNVITALRNGASIEDVVWGVLIVGVATFVLSLAFKHIGKYIGKKIAAKVGSATIHTATKKITTKIIPKKIVPKLAKLNRSLIKLTKRPLKFAMPSLKINKYMTKRIKDKLVKAGTKKVVDKLSDFTVGLGYDRFCGYSRESTISKGTVKRLRSAVRKVIEK
jgi:predicted  nucleic acid-binding Zn-ribbon protein